MRNTILLLSALALLAAACDERILPPPLDDDAGAGGAEVEPAVKDLGPEAEPREVIGCPDDGAKCSGRW